MREFPQGNQFQFWHFIVNIMYFMKNIPLWPGSIIFTVKMTVISNWQIWKERNIRKMNKRRKSSLDPNCLYRNAICIWRQIFEKFPSFLVICLYVKPPSKARLLLAETFQHACYWLGKICKKHKRFQKDLLLFKFGCLSHFSSISFICAEPKWKY